MPARGPYRGADADGRPGIRKGREERFAFLSEAVDQRVCGFTGRKTGHQANPLGSRAILHLYLEDNTTMKPRVKRARVSKSLRASGRTPRARSSPSSLTVEPGPQV